MSDCGPFRSIGSLSYALIGCDISPLAVLGLTIALLAIGLAGFQAATLFSTDRTIGGVSLLMGSAILGVVVHGVWFGYI